MKKNKKPSFILVLMLMAIIVLAIALIVYAISNLNGKKSTGETDDDFSVITEEKKNENHVQILDDGTKLNTSTALHEEKNVDGFSFKNIQLTTKDGLTTLTIDVTNNTGSNQPMTAFDIIFTDDDGNDLVTFGGFIKETTPNETTKLTSVGTLDYSNSYNFRIVKK